MIFRGKVHVNETSTDLSFSFFYVFDRPMEIGSKKPVGRFRQVVEVATAVCFLSFVRG